MATDVRVLAEAQLRLRRVALGRADRDLAGKPNAAAMKAQMSPVSLAGSGRLSLMSAPINAWRMPPIISAMAR
ncbi:hypothetical protein BLN97_21310 [Bradyrhizobium elkanii]|nr:hypothetical protein BLN97_21310 [Bradyrhizobium elkanii]